MDFINFLDDLLSLENKDLNKKKKHKKKKKKNNLGEWENEIFTVKDIQSKNFKKEEGEIKKFAKKNKMNEQKTKK